MSFSLRSVPIFSINKRDSYLGCKATITTTTTTTTNKIRGYPHLKKANIGYIASVTKYFLYIYHSSLFQFSTKSFDPFAKIAPSLPPI